MKITTAIWLAGILCLTSAGFSKAGPNDLVGAAIDSSEASQAQDLETAKDLSGKFIDGSVDIQSPTPVQAYSVSTGISTTKKLPAFAFTAPRKMKLTAVPPPPAETTGTFQKPGFLNSLVETVLAPMLIPVTGAVAGATFGKAYGEKHAGEIGGFVGLVVGGVVGLATGVVVGVVSAGVSAFQAICNLFQGKL